ncbi:MAG: 2-hydroxychromene-2-carboxylate isomerase [Paracoccaceae bacterium]
MTQIDYFFSTLSPFTYLAGDRLEQIARKHGVRIDYRPFDISRVFRETGTPPVPERHESRRIYRMQELQRIARKHAMPINVHPAHWPTNPVPSSTAIISAQAHGGGDVGGLVQSFLRACWAEEKDIAQDHVVKECLEANGFDAGLADRDMLSAVEVYERNTNEALGRNVFGSPTYILDHQVFWGQDRLDYLEAELEREN